jgi:hypothetical protein
LFPQGGLALSGTAVMHIIIGGHGKRNLPEAHKMCILQHGIISQRGGDVNCTIYNYGICCYNIPQGGGSMYTVFTQVLGLFIFVSIGFALGKLRVCDFSHTKVLSKLLVYVFLPCNVFKTLSGNFTISYITGNYTLILTGLLGGYPVGARLAAEQYHAGTLTKIQAERLLWFCSQAGPSFFFGIVAAQLGDSKSAWLLWGIQVLSALSVSRMLPQLGDKLQSFAKLQTKSGNDAMRSALHAISAVCGWIILFHVLIAFLQQWILWILPEPLPIILCGLLELTNGCLLLSQIVNPQTRFLLAAVMLNFGGLCVMIQTRSLTEGLNFRSYLYGKCLQTLFAALYARICLGHIWPFIPLLCIFLVRFALSQRKKDSFSRKIVV